MLDQINGRAVRDLAEHQTRTPAVCITYYICQNNNSVLEEEATQGDRICGLVVRVLGYRSGSLGSIPGTTRFSEKKKNSSGVWNGVHSAS
jgi:hypothetical protein